ncbi:HAD family hydrolase [Pseudonocardia sp. WMMC193]|uniref:HAD family hydrolase n=1 Tax=Pseudonocardia sp. WMMC193 TaxID=2911965 RepID=UPI001F3B6634|nr:HAD hydrolase-like protein [Pseudonocardia sp. WMMC193]MCF7547563.1 HAD hydrolase-like protein [Pseudonocardia sp. WMMC193]
MAPGLPPVQAVIFDLDGTLVQTRIASWEIFEQVNRRYDLGVDEPEQYFDLFRGNVYESIAKLCRTEAEADEVKDAFLTLLRSDYTPPLVPGVSDVVRRLASHATLAVMSSNAMGVMRRVLTHNHLAFCFAHVFGGDVTPDKKTAIRTFLADSGSGFGRRCAADYDEAGDRPTPDPAGTVLVTDTAGDVRDALEVGIRVVGVSWGMHSVEALTAAGAEFVALWPQEIVAHLLGDAAAATGACAVPSSSEPVREPADVIDESLVAAAARIRRERRQQAADGFGDRTREAADQQRDRGSWPETRLPRSGPAPAPRHESDGELLRALARMMR